MPRVRIQQCAQTFAVLSCVTALACGQEPKLVAETEPRSPEEQRKLFHLPPGFEIELVAAEPDIQKPMNIAFDSRSRLWVTSSIEYPFPAMQGTNGRDSIRILDDIDRDGRIDRVVTFAEGLNIPIGILPMPDSNSCIAYSIPTIDRFTDEDGDGLSDKREKLYGDFGYADTHGMSSSYTWGLDGWIYATHGFANQSSVRGSDGHTIVMHSGNTYRFRPDGSRIEQWSWGQVNPFGLAFDRYGNLFSADCHSRPIMMLLRGAYYQSFGKPHDGLGFGPEICKHEHGSTGIAGIVHYGAEQFPVEYRNTMFTGNPVTNRINCDRLEQHGSTVQTVHLPDFLRCDDPWFRPVDLELGPDGSLYIADFYNRIIGHYEVPLTHPGRDRDRGRIWRVRYTGEGGELRSQPRHDWTRASLAELIGDLGHANSAVRTIALNQVVWRFGAEAAGPLREVTAGDYAPDHQATAMWALSRLGPVVVRSDADPLLRTHWLRAIAERPIVQPSLRAVFIRYLSDPDGMVQRAAAEAMARHPGREAIAALLAQRRGIDRADPQLLHAVRIALREQIKDPESFEAVSKLDLDAVDRTNLADVVPGIHSAAAGEWLYDYLLDTGSAEPQAYLEHIVRNIPPARLSEVVQFARAKSGGSLVRQAAMIQQLRAAMQFRNASPPVELVRWGEEIGGELLGSQDHGGVQEAIKLARALRLASLTESITGIAHRDSAFPSLRADAISMLADVAFDDSVELISDIVGGASEPMPLRQHAAGVLGQHPRRDVQQRLVGHLRVASEQLAVHIAAALAGGQPGCETLLAEVAAGKVSPRILQHPLVHARLQAAQLPELEQRIARLTESLPPVEQRINEMIEARRNGFTRHSSDSARGAQLFDKHCAICHRIGERGAKIGPQLDGIGTRGPDRLLEDLLDPNRNVDQAFRSAVVALKNGRVLTGLVVDDSGDVVTLADVQGQLMQISKHEIEERRTARTSPMPANVAELLTEPEFYDLLSYLLNGK